MTPHGAPAVEVLSMMGQVEVYTPHLITESEPTTP